MYQLKEEDLDFVTDDYIPVSVAGSTTKIGTIEYLQREVQENATNGGVFAVNLDRSGSYWSEARLLRGSVFTDFWTTHRITSTDNTAEILIDGVTTDVCKFGINIPTSVAADTYKNWAPY